MRTLIRILQLAAFTSLATSTAFAQAPLRLEPPPPDRIQRLTLTDGSEVLGRVVAVDGDTVQFQSALGVTKITRHAIRGIRVERPGRVFQGQYYHPNPNSTRLIFAPSGRMLEKDEGYFSDYWVFFPGFAHGLTNRLSIGGGMSIFPGLDPSDQLFFLTPKVGVVQSPTVNAAVGALVIRVPDERTTGILYGVTTWGHEDASVTAGLGYGFHGGDLADRPAVMLGGELRVAQRMSLITENYLLPGDLRIIAAGPRFIGRDISVDLTLANFASGGDSFTAPLLSFTWRWGA